MRLLLSLAVCGCLASTLQANGLSSVSCATDTIADYNADFPHQSDACANGILNFSGFEFQSSGNGVGTLLTADQIDLTPVGTPDQTGVTGFSITGLNDSSITVAPGQDATYVVDWLFVIDAGPIAGGASLGMDPPTGDVTVTQYYCLDSIFNDPTYTGSAPTCGPSLDGGGSPDVQMLSVSTPDDLTDTVTFNPPALDLADVMTVIQLTGAMQGAGFDSVNGNSQIDPAAPEPSSFVLIGGALLAAGFLRKRIVRQ